MTLRMSLQMKPCLTPMRNRRVRRQGRHKGNYTLHYLSIAWWQWWLNCFGLFPYALKWHKWNPSSKTPHESSNSCVLDYRYPSEFKVNFWQMWKCCIYADTGDTAHQLSVWNIQPFCNPVAVLVRHSYCSGYLLNGPALEPAILQMFPDSMAPPSIGLRM